MSKLQDQMKTAKVVLNSKEYLGSDRKEIKSVLDWLVRAVEPSDVLDLYLFDRSVGLEGAMANWLEGHLRSDQHLIREVYRKDVDDRPTVSVKFTQ